MLVYVSVSIEVHPDVDDPEEAIKQAEAHVYGLLDSVNLDWSEIHTEVGG